MLEAELLAKSYPTPTTPLAVLADISLTVQPGERLVVMGPSGSGKSTLLAILGGLEPPTSGRVRLDGRDPYQLSASGRAEFRNRQIGFVFQEHHLLESCTAVDNVLLPAIAAGRVPDALVERARDLLQRVGLGDRQRHLPAELSGGERQRVAVARAAMLSPRLILADEPTGQLDSRNAAGVIDLLADLVDEGGGMLVVVTHDATVAQQLADGRQGRRLELVDGRLVS
jgi:lipoprotein-releasing system ATP-binding protein